MIYILTDPRLLQQFYITARFQINLQRDCGSEKKEENTNAEKIQTKLN